MLIRSPRCSFCGRRHDEVGKLVSGPRVYICEVCVALAQRAIDADPDATPPAQKAQRVGRASLLGRLVHRLLRRPGHRLLSTRSA
jgi:ATP-dependent protease Clp ATPase subunit